MTPIAAFLLLVTVLAIHAGWRGGAPERLAAAAMLAPVHYSATDSR